MQPVYYKYKKPEEEQKKKEEEPKNQLTQSWQQQIKYD